MLNLVEGSTHAGSKLRPLNEENEECDAEINLDFKFELYQKIGSSSSGTSSTTSTWGRTISPGRHLTASSRSTWGRGGPRLRSLTRCTASKQTVFLNATLWEGCDIKRDHIALTAGRVGYYPSCPVHRSCSPDRYDDSLKHSSQLSTLITTLAYTVRLTTRFPTCM